MNLTSDIKDGEKTLDYFYQEYGNKIFNAFKQEGVKEAFESIICSAKDLGVEIIVQNENIAVEKQPAVFIFNHQSYIDGLVAIRVNKNVNAIGIAMEEMKYHPVLGPILTEAGAIFIDRKDRVKSIISLRPAAEALRNGTSVGIFPEGFISADGNLGPFKKGAFYMAMYGKVPLIPVVIKNSYEILPKNKKVINPGTVYVTVLDLSLIHI